MSTTSLLVRPRCRNRPSGPTASATCETKAMTSWSVVASISLIRSDVHDRAGLDDRERIGRDQATTDLGPADGDLHLEHRARTGPARTRRRPSPGACSGGSTDGLQAAAPASGRQVGGDVAATVQAVPGDRVRGALGRGSGRRRGPRPGPPRSAPGRRSSRSRRRPGAPRSRRGRRAHPRRRAASRPLDRVPAARVVRVAPRPPGRCPRRHRASPGPAAGASSGRRPVRGGEEQRAKVGASTRGRIDLRLRVAQADVDLEQDRAVVRQHEARVQEARGSGCRGGPSRRGSAGGRSRGSPRPPASSRSGSGE